MEALELGAQLGMMLYLFFLYWILFAAGVLFTISPLLLIGYWISCWIRPKSTSPHDPSVAADSAPTKTRATASDKPSASDSA